MIFYLLLLLFSPPMLQDANSVSTGVRLDQIFLCLALPALIYWQRGSLDFLLRRKLVRCLAIFPVLCVLTALASSVKLDDFELGPALARIWGGLRPLMAFSFAALLARKLDARQRMGVLVWVAALNIPVFVVGFGQFLHWPWMTVITTSLYPRKAGFDDVLNGMQWKGLAYATFNGQHEAYGAYSSLIVCILFALLASRRQGFTRGHGDVLSGLARALLVFSALCGLAGIGISFARGAMIGAVAGLCVLVVLHKMWKVLLFAAITIPAFVVAASEGLKDTLMQAFTLRSWNGAPIYEARLAFWTESLRIWQDNFLLGVSGVQLPPPDNLLIDLLASNGIVGVVWFSVLVIVVLSMTRRVIRQRQHAMRPVAIGVLATTVAFLVNGAAGNVFVANRVQELYWTIVALATIPLPDENPILESFHQFDTAFSLAG